MTDNKSFLRVNDIFYSLQGEGARAGIPNVFVRLSNCNLRCNGEVVDGVFQPVCDTEFMSGHELSLDEILEKAQSISGMKHPPIIWTGGEPSLQLTDGVVEFFKAAECYQAIETNGTKALPKGLDWVCVSPKTADHTILVSKCDEVKFVRMVDQGIPKTKIKADHYLISPHCEPEGFITRETLDYCIRLVLANPSWRLSVQQHKLWQVK